MKRGVILEGERIVIIWLRLLKEGPQRKFCLQIKEDILSL